MIFFKHIKPNGSIEHFAFDENTVEEIAQFIKPEWVQITSLPLPPSPPLPTLKAAFILQIDADADRIYADVIGNRSTEYTQAEKEAQAYKDAGYTGTVPSTVQSWASVKAWTPTQSANDILAQATAWRTVAAAIRANRLAEKEAARVATDLEGIAASQSRWSGFVIYIRAQLGV